MYIICWSLVKFLEKAANNDFGQNVENGKIAISWSKFKRYKSLLLN